MPQTRYRVEITELSRVDLLNRAMNVSVPPFQGMCRLLAVEILRR